MLPLSERFWPKVRKTDGCWEWASYRNPKGYGRIGGGRRGSTPLLAHRASWEMHYGPIPKGMSVLHHCDNPACVRPDHLWLGTLADNNADMKAKGRASRKTGRSGEDHPRARLTVEIVRTIRRENAETGKRLELAQRYGVTVSAIDHILSRRTWKAA